MPAFDITPRLTAGRQLIESYGDGGFTISGHRFSGSVVVFPERVTPWSANAASAGELTADAFADVIAAAGALQVLVIGCGRQFTPPPATLLHDLRAAGLAPEWMDTGAACRTYNVLLLEGRGVAATLMAVD